MTDQELDVLLAAWKIPGPSDKLHTKAMAGFRASQPRRWPRFGRILVWAAAAAVVLVCLEAFAQTLQSPQVPFVVESELTTYSPDGAVRTRLHIQSVTENARERMLSVTIDGDAYATLRLNASEAGHSILQSVHRLARSLIVGPQQPDPTRADARIAVCGDPSCRTLGDWTMQVDRSTCRNNLFAGEETILNHTTAALRLELPSALRLTAWLAPDLGCFPLQVLVEQRNPSGSFSVRERRDALKITMNRN